MKSKILKREILLPFIEELQMEGRTVVFTNGCFDLLHVGHVRYLEEAKELGDILVVGINSDESTRKLKGKGRPFISENERAEILAALGCVDFVTIFEEETPVDLLLKLKPHWHVKGGDYAGRTLPETQAVLSYGGKIRVLSYIPGHSTSLLLEKISACLSSK